MTPALIFLKKTSPIFMLNLSSFGIFSGSKEEKELDKGFCISISETSEINANG